MRIRLHWLLIATAVLSIVCWLGAMWALERANRRAYARDTQALADAGFVVDWDTVAAEITPTDPAALSTWTSWSLHATHAPQINEDDRLHLWMRNGRGAPPAAAHDFVDQQRAVVASILPLLRDGRLRWGIRATLHAWLSGPRDVSSQLDGTSNLFASRILAKWLRWQALTAPDPVPWLEDLDRLVSAGDPPLCLIDGMIWIALAEIRDETRFAHIRWLGGRVVAEHPWYTAAFSAREFSASIWMGERLYCTFSFDHMLTTGDWSAWLGDWPAWSGTFGTSPTWRFHLMNVVRGVNPVSHWQWATLPAGASFVRWTQAQHEADMRGEPPPPPVSGVGGEGNLLATLNVSSALEIHIAIGEHYLRGRILRLAARLLIDHRDGEALPSDAAELRARYGNLVLAALPESVPVLYTREADGGFTLAGDISVPAGLFGMLRRDHRLTISAAEVTPGDLPSNP